MKLLKRIWSNFTKYTLKYIPVKSKRTDLNQHNDSNPEVFELATVAKANLPASSDEPHYGLQQTFDPFIITLWVPAYQNDVLSKYTIEWASKLTHQIHIPYPLIGTEVTKSNILSFISQNKGVKSLKIFTGHGRRNALLGSNLSLDPSHEESKDKYTIIYSADMSDGATSFLFAFCCYAGSELGPHYSQVGSKRFLGYTGSLPLYLENAECAEVWCRIFIETVIKIKRDQAIQNNHERFLRKLYKDFIDYFESGRGQANKNSFLMISYLEEHLHQICLH